MKIRTHIRNIAAFFIFLCLVATTLAFNSATHEKRAAFPSSLIPPPSSLTHPSTLLAKRVLIISLDGLDARYLWKRDEYGLRIPALRSLMAKGATARGVVSVYPSVTYPAHTSIVTGAYPARHGVFGNELFEPPDAPQTGSWYWFARDIRAETLWGAAARRGLSTAMVSWPVAVGAGDYNVPEMYRTGGSRLEAFAMMKANARPKGLIEEVGQADPALFRNVNADESDDMRTRFAEYIIEKKRPQVMLVHLFDLDHFQHDYGPFTPQAFAILEKSDGYVARLLAAHERAGTLAETAIFIVSDHGFLPVSKLIHPGVLLEMAGLLKVKEEKDEQGRTTSVKITDWRALPYVTAGSCAIILRDPNDRAALRKLREIIRLYNKIRIEMGRGIILRVLGAKELRKFGTNTRATLILEAADGFSFGKNYTGSVVTPNTQRGQHGYLPTHPSYYASFIASGAGIKRRGDLGLIRMIDIGPTIARTLGLHLRDAQGRALWLEKVKSER